MASDAILRTYGDVSAREDVVLNAIEILTARETQIMNMLPKTVAINTIHSFLVDTLATAGSLAVEEAADYTATANSTPTRLTNIVEVIAKNFKVSRTQQNITHYSGQDELSRQTEKALMDWANAAEFDLIRATLASGVSGTVPKFNGLIAFISTNATTNVTTHTSAVIWSASILDGLMKLNWDKSNGSVATDIFMGSFLRALTDGFTQKTNVVVNSPGISTIVRTVSSYETAFGTLMIHKHRYVFVSGTDLTDRVLGINPSKWGMAYLQKPMVDTELARSGDYDNRAVVGKFTLEGRNAQSNFFAQGFTTS